MSKDKADFNPGKGMIIDGIVASEAIDSSGEVVKISGVDISSLTKDGTLNTEHVNPEDAKTDSPWSVVIGKCIEAKKIASEDDCENARHRLFWNKIKLPFIYGKFRLFDGSGHKSASEAAAILRDSVHAGEPPLINFSIEGATVEKKGNTIERCIARRVAATLKACNKTAVSGVLEDPNGPPLPGKSRDLLEEVGEDAKKFEKGGLQRLGGYQGSYNPIVQDDKFVNPFLKFKTSVEKLKKTLTAGSTAGAPASLVGGSALQAEDLEKKKTLVNLLKAAIRDWDGTTSLKEFVKHRLPEVSDAFIDHFTGTIDDINVKRRLLVKAEAQPQPQLSVIHRPKLPSDPDLADMYRRAIKNGAAERATAWLAWLETIDPAVYSNAVSVVLDQYKIPNDKSLHKALDPAATSLHDRVGLAMAELERHFGQEAALLAYWAFMVPALKGIPQTVQKAERILGRTLKKNEGEPVDFKGQKVQPGQVQVTNGPMKGKTMKLLHVDGKHHFVHDGDSLRKLKNEHAGKAFVVTQPHQIIEANTVVQAGKHGLPHLSEHPQQAELLDGLDLQGYAPPPRHYQSGAFADKNRWNRSSKGHLVYVKEDPLGHDPDFDPFSMAQRGAAYHTMARDVFGTGDHVPTTAAFRHPVTGEHHTVQKAVEKAEHFDSKNQEHISTLMRLGNSGTLDKLALMDMVMGHDDRHRLNYVLTPGQQSEIHLIDNDLTFPVGPHAPTTPHYWTKYKELKHGNDSADHQLHPHTVDWINKLDPVKFEAKLRAMGGHPDMIKEAVRRMKALKNVTAKGNVSSNAAFVSPFLGSEQ